jgi:seryl-tRNA synthetase
MIDRKLLAEDPQMYAENNRKRGYDHIDVSLAVDLINKRTVAVTEVDALRAEINKLSTEISITKNNSEKKPLLERASEIKPKIKVKEDLLNEVEAKLLAQLKQYPNLLREDVPDSLLEEDFELIRTVGEPTKFDFEPKNHLDIGEALGIIDVERAAKVSGSRFTYLKGGAALLQFALIQYALETLVKKGFTPAITPHLISTEAMDAMGYLEKGGEEEIYHIKQDELVLIGTSEQSLGPMMMNESIDMSDLPMRFVGFSPCYRREAGSYGKDVRGILRLHQFDKLEMFAFSAPDNSDKEHELLLSMQETLMTGLGLPYRVIKLSAGDTGTPSARTYDIETWMPSEGRYRETHSTSNTTDYQTRRLKTRLKGEGGKFVHALNGTAFAIGRTIIAIIENGQNKDGSITIPKVLHPYMMGKTKID